MTSVVQCLCDVMFTADWSWRQNVHYFMNVAWRRGKRERGSRIVDRTCRQSILSHTGSPERTDVSERIHTETQEDVTRVRNVPRDKQWCFYVCDHTVVSHPLYLWNSKCQTVSEKKERMNEWEYPKKNFQVTWSSVSSELTGRLKIREWRPNFYTFALLSYMQWWKATRFTCFSSILLATFLLISLLVFHMLTS